MKKAGISIIMSIFILIGIKAQTIDEGTINGADYEIIIPDNWNEGLVMYCHGYEEIGYEDEEEMNEEESEIDESSSDEEEGDFFDIFLDRGFAVAASAYKHQGLVIKDGVEDTEALRTYFENKYGKPEICIITGHSMGGMITIATIEQFPSEYDGAMPLCGWLAPVYQLIKISLDMLVTYDYLFGDNDGKIVSGAFIESENIQKKLDKNREMKKLYAEHFRLKEEDLAEVIGFFQYVFKETSDWMGGFPVGNEQTIYNGFGFKDDELNKNMLRYTENENAREYVAQYYTTTGKITDPVLAVHTTYDELLPVSNYAYYEQVTAINNISELYCQQYVVRDGHCNFENKEIEKAFEQLLIWIKEGKYPKWIRP